jgi:hypothetical protein
LGVSSATVGLTGGYEHNVKTHQRSSRNAHSCQRLTDFNAYPSGFCKHRTQSIRRHVAPVRRVRFSHQSAHGLGVADVQTFGRRGYGEVFFSAL